MPRALICGVTGQDGAYLAQLLLAKGYEVWGTSRDAQVAPVGNLQRLAIAERVRLVSMAPRDFRSVLEAIDRARPDELYNLAGQTSVGLSFEQPAEALESIASSTLNLLEALRFLNRPIRFYNAGSSECFGNTGTTAADEHTPFHPRSPYAVAKSTAHWLVDNYRAAYGLAACTGILFNHESPLRPRRFVTRKIVEAALDIADGDGHKLALGNLEVWRDWGWSPEYVEAMWAMLQADCGEDFVIATGVSHSLRDFVAAVFAELGLDWQDHVLSDPALMRRTDLEYSRGNADKAARLLGWRAQKTMPAVAAAMVSELRAQRLADAASPAHGRPR
ncbi:GDP-mannose 4,6-dehydratase [Rubrivivax sp. A210]|uniref:GDP-mannose 4,6-dehydratase n=1 Tax=Rubrivivax sp. A210 TaxID=2772301 RepID=UPI00191B3C5B|nr:GDP-mannose 4,6-dehydratase [Rubrivivax sp. A210]CAD5373971.1 GDP-mannose 4,6-dehydratase [Rubrivivax sp. A210]